jgi:nitrate/nitrite transporter NarK
VQNSSPHGGGISEHRRQREQSVSGASSPDARRRRRFLVKLTVISSLGGLLFGYDTGVISGALLYMRADLHLTPITEATVVSALLFPGAAVGALLGGRIADALGRKRSLEVCAGLFLLISFVFPPLVAAVGPTVTFGLFVLINLGSLAFVVKFCPETRGRGLEEIEDDFREHDAAHVAHRPPVGVYGS